MRSLSTPRLNLLPQCAAHAEALFSLLADPRMYLHEGEPPQSLAWLRERLIKLETRRSTDGTQQWLNWVVMLPTGQTTGYVQATVQADGTAYVAYMFGSAWWGLGLASEAVSAMIDELAASHGATRLRAVLKIANHPSLRLLQRLQFVAAAAEDIDADERMLVRAIQAGPAPCMTHTRVKICCIASREEAALALAAGASALGLVSAMPSGPGPIAEAVIAEIVAGLAPAVDSFLLTALLDADTIAAQHARCGTRTVQLVDRLHAGELPRLRRRLPDIRLVQVVHVEDDSALEEARLAAPHVDALLLDSGRFRGPVKELGGTGRVHDWRISRRIREGLPDLPLWLAGGLNAGNVAQAIRAVQPWGVDLCSSVRSHGALDARKLRDFFTAIHGAETECRERPPG